MADIGCDQVAWLNDSLRRYAFAIHVHVTFPTVSQLDEGARIACIAEIADILGHGFSDIAKGNLISGLKLVKNEKEKHGQSETPCPNMKTSTSCTDDKR